MMVVIKIRDVIGKMQGLVTSQLYTFYGVYLMLLSMLRTVYDIMVIILIAMGATIVAVWIAVAIAIAFGPFGIPVMIAMTATGLILTAIFIGIAIPLGIISDFLAKTMKLSGLAALPLPPRKR
jgi:cytochrome bd-type quinol oxidase subunit 1